MTATTRVRKEPKERANALWLHREKRDTLEPLRAREARKGHYKGIR